MSHIMTKAVYAIIEQRRCRSVCTSTQSDQHLCCSLPRKCILSTGYKHLLLEPGANPPHQLEACSHEPLLHIYNHREYMRKPVYAIICEQQRCRWVHIHIVCSDSKQGLPVYAICEQQRHRSACPSVQSDQHLCCSLLRKCNFSTDIFY